MSKYTTTIKTMIDSGVKIFDFSYPIFDEKYRSVLETKIINRYLFREIGLETVQLFKHFLSMRLNEIMPFYNKQYLANKVFETYDPYKNKDFYIEDNRDTSGKNSGSVSSSSNNTEHTTFSDTPSSKLGNVDYATTITDNTDENENNSSNTGNFTTTENYVSHLHGHDGMKYPADILLNVRETINNLDVEIIENLSDLFMNVY
jgi:hypothetical protein